MKLHSFLFGLCIGFAMLLSGDIFAQQTGVRTQNPNTGTRFHLDAANDNAATPTNAQRLNDILVTMEGALSVGVTNPATRVDLRSGLPHSIIGLGMTSQTAAEAGAGALRYNPNPIEPTDPASNHRGLEYSDGIDWHMVSNNAPKAMVIARKPTTQSVSYNVWTQVTNWTEDLDNESTFNASTGVFTAPRDGFYSFHFSARFANYNTANNNRHIVLSIDNMSSNPNNLTRFRSVFTYPSNGLVSRTIAAAGMCYAVYDLNEGDTVVFNLVQRLTNTNNSLSLNTNNNGRYTTISIIEL